MSIGAVIALVIGGAGMAIPEMTMLASIFKKKLVVMIVLVIFLTAVVSGYLFNIYYIMDKKKKRKDFGLLYSRQNHVVVADLRLKK